jgi:predicted small metal-binding protein
MSFSYACADYPGMETCAGRFETESEDELWRHIELHALAAHGEDPEAWADDDRSQVKALIRSSE